MLNEKEKVLLNHLRSNSRTSLAEISKATDIPISTLFSMLRRLEKDTIHKHTSLIDFSKTGHSIRLHIAMASRDKQKLKEFLINNRNVNSLSSLINGFDFYADCIFRDWKQLTSFKESLERFDITRINETFIVEELARESFST
jgi:DNA-binding Lrp family transcriptional regulator